MTNTKQIQAATETGYRIRLTNPATGKGFVISPEEDAHIRLLEDGLEGFGATELLVETEPYADGTGGHPVRRRFGERVMTVMGELTDLAPAEELRRYICSLLDPLGKLVMEVTLGKVTRQIEVIPWGRPTFRQSTFFSPVEVTLSFLAPDPFWRESAPRQLRFWHALPLLTFPMNFWQGAGTAAGYFRTTDTALVQNPGDAACGFTAWLTAGGGTVVNPAIRLGERYIRFQATLADGQVARVDTHPRGKNLWIDGVRSFTFHRESDFFLLPVGENRVAVEAEAGLDFLSARLEYTPMYYSI